MGLDTSMFLIIFFTALQLTPTFSEGTRIQESEHIVKTIGVQYNCTAQLINI